MLIAKSTLRLGRKPNKPFPCRAIYADIHYSHLFYLRYPSTKFLWALVYCPEIPQALGIEVRNDRGRVRSCNFIFTGDTFPATVRPGSLLKMRHEPVRTSNVANPPFCPKRMSVFSLSPTIIVRLGSKWTLFKSINSVIVRNEVNTYFALTQSSMVVDGLPVQTGSLPSAYRRGALMAPAPGSRP